MIDHISIPIYHIIPKDMRGETLYPLNQIKDIYPDVYKQEASKYKGREKLMEERISPLSCYWNDVLHFSTISPEAVEKTMKEIGFPFESMDYLTLSLDDLQQGGWVIFHEPINGKRIYTTDPAYLADHASIPPEVKIYYQDCYNRDIRPLLYYGLPHVLFKGTVRIGQ